MPVEGYLKPLMWDEELGRNRDKDMFKALNYSEHRMVTMYINSIVDTRIERGYSSLNIGERHYNYIKFTTRVIYLSFILDSDQMVRSYPVLGSKHYAGVDIREFVHEMERYPITTERTTEQAITNFKLLFGALTTGGDKA